MPMMRNGYLCTWKDALIANSWSVLVRGETHIDVDAIHSEMRRVNDSDQVPSTSFLLPLAWSEV